MNLKNLFTKLSFTVLLLTLFTALSFAQTIYVSNTNGNDVTGDGKPVGEGIPYKTITTALGTLSADGATLIIDADTYAESFSVTRSVTFVAQTYASSSTVNITGTVTINGSGKTVSMGETGQKFKVANLTLTAGTLNILSTNLIVADGGVITRSGGTINNTPTTSNVTVTYTGTSNITAGAELPSELGGGQLISTSTKTVTVDKAITFTSDSPTSPIIDNQSTGTLIFNQLVSGKTESTDGSASEQEAVIKNTSTGTVTLTGGISGYSKNSDGDAFFIGLNNASTGTINVGSGMYEGSIFNGLGGTLTLLADVTFKVADALSTTIDNTNASSVIKLGAYTLTLAGNGVTLDNAGGGKVISTTAATNGSGVLNVTGRITTNGELPNLNISGSSASVVLNAAASVYGTFTLNSARTNAGTEGFNDGGFNLSIYGNFNRTNDTPLNYAATGTLTFPTATAQTFNPGASLVINDLVINKASNAVVTLGASVEVAGDLTITAGSLDVSNFNLNLSGVSTFDNSGNSYSSTGIGYVVFEGASGTITGSGTFGNLLVNVTAANNVVTGSSINFSGILYINQGQLQISDGDVITFNNTLVTNPTIKINTTAVNLAGLTSELLVGTGTVLYSANTNLYYLGTGAYNVNTLTLSGDQAGLEWTKQPLKINNLTVATSNTVTGYSGGPSTIAGVLTVAKGAVLAQGALVYNLTGSSKTHSILGDVTGGTLFVSGTAVAINGTSSSTGGNAAVNSIDFEPVANNSTFTSTDLKTVTGNLTLVGSSNLTGSSAVITMNATTATLGGNLAVGAGAATDATVTINGTSTSVFTGTLTLTAGTLNLTRGGNSTVISNTMALVGGTLNLGSNITAGGDVTQTATNINAGGYKFIADAVDYTRNGAGTFTNGTLTLDATNGSLTLTPGTSFSVPAIEFVGDDVANNVTLAGNGMEVTGTALFDNASTVATGANTLTLSGDVITVKDDAGAFSGAIALTGSSAVVTLAEDFSLGNLTINSAGSVTLLSDKESTPVARTITCGTFTQTAGDVVLGINTLSVTGATFTRTAGNWSMSTGSLALDNAAMVVTPGSSWSIANLDIQDDATAAAANKAFTVTEQLTLTDGTFTANGSSNKMIIADGATIDRKNGDLAAAPVFGGNVNLTYSGYDTKIVHGGISNTAADPTVITTINVHGLSVGQLVKIVCGGTDTDGLNGTIAIVATVPSTTTFTLTDLASTAIEATVINQITDIGVSTTLGSEFPTTDIITDFAVDGCPHLYLNKNMTVNGTLSLGGLLDATTSSKTVTMADSSSLELMADGDIVLDKKVVKSGVMNLIYNGATTTTTMELGSVSSSAYTTATGNVTVKSAVATDYKLTIGGTLTFDGGNLTPGNDLTVKGNIVQTTRTGGSGFFGAAAYYVNLTGDSTNIGLKTSQTVPAGLKIRVNKNTSTTPLTLSGGNLDFASNTNVLYLVNGLVKTGSNTIILKQYYNNGQPTQGFDRSGVTGTNVSHIIGNVKKFLIATDATNSPIMLTRVEYPVGTETNYRPLALQFNTLPTASVNVTVSHINSNPGGSNGFPITSGDLTVTNYPDFYWLMKSDLTLQPSVTYDIEASAEGYTDYETDGIQNLRFVRRFDGNTANQWIVQGGTSYDNSTNGTNPVVIVRNATGAVSTQGAVFTYSQLNKAPVFASVADRTVEEGDTVAIAWSVTDPDIGQTPTVAVVQKPSKATFDASKKTLTWITTNSDSGKYSIIVSATDGYKTVYDTVSVTVTNKNIAPSFAAEGASYDTTATVKYGSTLTLTYVAIDADGSTPVYSYKVVPTPDTAATVSMAAGVLTFTPAFGDAGKTFTFSVAAVDASTFGDTVETVVTVGYAFNKGDVNGSGSITSADASPILEYVVGLRTLTDEQKYYADVNRDNAVGAIDAAWILYAALHDGTFPTAKSIAASGNVEFGSFTSENGVYSLPISLSKTSGVLSVYTEINLGSNVEFKNVTSRLPEGWIVSSNFENGVLKVAMAGTEALSEGNYAIVNLTLADKEAVASVEGSAKLNDESSSTMAAKVREIPAEFALSQNYPNPFNPTTSIKYQLANNANVKLVVYNMLGQVVKTLVNQEQEAGYYTIRWNGTNEFGGKVSSGIYIYRIIAGDFISTVKMNLLK
jgi:hypothetical protein